MLVFVYILLFSICFIGLRFHKEYNTGYLAIDRCNTVKGFFIMLVFISHINQYITKSGYVSKNIGDELYFTITSVIGQLMVVMFLFFSGYGIMESFKKKGGEYVSTMPKKRILTTLLNFDVAVLCFVLLNLLLGKTMHLKQVVLSFIAWDSVGNSNWYIFCILLCYFLSYFALRFYNSYFARESVYIYLLFPVFIFTIITIIILSYHKQSYWYNTMLCFPFGMLFSVVKDKAENIILPDYYKCLFTSLILFLILSYIPYPLKGLTYNMESISFAMIVVLLMMKIESNNKWLQWMGQNLFPLYIYQRLAMMAIYELPRGHSFICAYPLLYVVVCFICVIVISSQFHRWQIKIP